MAVTELMLWSLSGRTWQTSLSVGRQCRLSQSFRRLLRFTGQSKEELLCNATSNIHRVSIKKRPTFIFK